MRLTSRETEKLMLFLAGELAEKRKARGVKLNYPEAIALISARLHELARDGKRVVNANRSHFSNKRRCHGGCS